MNNDTVFFIPTRKGSKRVKSKNTRVFCDVPGGLLEIKLKQLLNVDSVDIIVLSTNDEPSIDVALQIDPHQNKIKIDLRPSELCDDNTVLEDLIAYVPTVVEASHIFWVHATSPFIQSEDYEFALKTYFKSLDEGFDSLMSVTKYQSFLWSQRENNFINFDRTQVKWPRTQDLEPLYDVNSGYFISSKDNYRQYNDRIGIRPFLHELDKVRAFDIDWEEDFSIGEIIYEKYFKHKTDNLGF